MIEDLAFRIALIAILILRTIAGLYFWLNTLRSGEKVDRRAEGLWMCIGLRVGAGIYGIGIMAWLVDPRWMAWSSLSLPDWLRWIGVGLIIIGVLTLNWGLRSLGKNFTDTVVTRKEHTLVTSGPYRWVRNPLYCSYFVIVTGMTLLMANWFPAVAGAFVLTLVVIRTQKEEENLIERFGDEYREYMQRVGRFFPRLHRQR
ncbi:MAG: isoprenylcysteine carboxylmethyltransferase family protein [Gammaproteobacteria bacterium]|nr:isoprenylcysteine carboxylmethyltransferase family protein [Gammaproteobacteria bacterium]